MFRLSAEVYKLTLYNLFFFFYNNHFAGLFFFFLKLACTVEWDKHLVSISCEEMHSEKVVTGVHF